MRFLLLLAVAVLGLTGTASAAPSYFTQQGLGSMSPIRYGAAAAPLPDGDVVIAGGTFLATAEVFDVATGTFSRTPGALSVERAYPAAAALPDGRVLVAGGGSATEDLRSAELFDPRTGRFSPTGSMAAVRIAAGAAPLRGGKVLVAGGWTAGAVLRAPSSTTRPRARSRPRAR